MIEIEFGEPEKKTFELYDERRNLRGKSLDDIVSSSSVDLSKVVSKPISITSDDKDDKNEEISHFLKSQDPAYRFHIIRIGCTFRCADGEHFSKAWLSAPMKVASDSDESPLVWSMTPENITEEVESTNAVKIGSELKFLKAEVSHESSSTKKDFFITSYREGQGSPLWEFNKTGNIDINGSYVCYIIIRAKKTDYITGEIQVKVVLKEKTYLLFNKQKEMENMPLVTFEIKPDTMNE